ncbi:MAG: hypothetical protein IKN01_04410 [Prevotella sp.]|nr:hypothetical protein [Prevotella sp.]
MIDILPKIHDRNTLEFKVGYKAPDGTAYHDFEMNTWIFIPETLDVNKHTYQKENFYRDILSYIRLITPYYQLEELASTSSLPYQRLSNACLSLTPQSSEKEKEQENYEREIKMFASIFKSSIRDTFRAALSSPPPINQEQCRKTLESIARIFMSYRSLGEQMEKKGTPHELMLYFRYGDEFLSNVVEQHVFRMIQHLRKHDSQGYEALKSDLQQLLDSEHDYRLQAGYLCVKDGSAEDNTEFVYHAGKLKKYIESNLYLPTHKRRNAVFLEQVVFSLAAGLSMIFATVISFAFQQTYGNFTLPFFIALVISYMFKDRIKELVRVYFATRLSSRLFDYKTEIRVGFLKVGWCKEGFDFMNPEKITQLVRKMRNRHSPLVIGRGVEEQVIQFRKKIHLNRKAISKLSPYPLSGINDIVRYNLSEFMRKMDNPKVPLCANKGNGQYIPVEGRKVYYLNFIIQLKYEEATRYRRYRICLSRKGIHDIEEI